MKVLLGVCVIAIAGARVAAQQPGVVLSVAEQNELAHKRCAVCHTDAKPLGGLSLEHFDAAQPDPAIARMMLVKIKDDGAISAAGMPVPPPETRDAFIAALAATASHSSPESRWTIDLLVDPLTPNRGHSLVTARAELPSGTVLFQCNGASRRAAMQVSGKDNASPSSVDFDGLSTSVRAILAWCLAK